MKPKIICHMMSSVDGRLIGDRWSLPFDGKERDDLYKYYDEVSFRINADAWIIGRKTIHADFYLETFDFEKYSPASEFKNHIGNKNSKRICIILDSKGKICYKEDNLNGDNIITILGETVSDAYLSHLQNIGISYIFAGKDGNNLEKALDTLDSEFGLKEILLEGGGLTNGMFLKAGLIDELSLLIYPGVDGLSGISSIIEYKGLKDEFPADRQALELLAVERLNDGVVWLQYKFHK